LSQLVECHGHAMSPFGVQQSLYVTASCNILLIQAAQDDKSIAGFARSRLWLKLDLPTGQTQRPHRLKDLQLAAWGE